MGITEERDEKSERINCDFIFLNGSRGRRRD